MALEIETGALVSEKGVEKRVYMFTTTGTDDKVRCCPHLQPLTVPRRRKCIIRRDLHARPGVALTSGMDVAFNRHVV